LRGSRAAESGSPTCDPTNTDKISWITAAAAATDAFCTADSSCMELKLELLFRLKAKEAKKVNRKVVATLSASETRNFFDMTALSYQASDGG
jgi:hypothetical protein